VYILENPSENLQKFLNYGRQRVSITELEYNNKVNAWILDEHDAEITVDENAERIILYHGTRACLEKVLKEGLLIRAGLKGRDTKMQMIDEVLMGEFGVEREQVPDWIWRYEYEYEKTIEPHLHMSVNLGTAVGYSHQGCEIKAQVRYHMFTWLLERRYGDFSVKDFEEKLFPNLRYGIISKLACERNGKESHVIQVEVPRGFLREEDWKFWRATVERVKETRKERPDLDAYRTLKTTTMEIRCLEHIPPEMFRKIWKVHWGSAWGWLAGDYKLEPIHALNM